MKCPACDNELTEINVNDVLVDVCKGGCGGIWFDNHELKKFDEPHEMAGDMLLEIERNGDIAVDHSQRRTCPRCGDSAIMMRHFSSIKRQMEVDECPKCGGCWLDAGELATMRGAHDNDNERAEASKEYFEDVFGDKLDKMRKESEAKLASARKVAHMLRFICPSYYIPGKQDWGAF